VLAVIGIIYGALVAMVQPDMKKLRRLLEREPSRVRRARDCAMNTQGVRAPSIRCSSRHQHRRTVPHRRMLSDRRHTRLISEYGGLKKVNAAPRGRVSHTDVVVDRAAGAERIRGGSF